MDNISTALNLELAAKGTDSEEAAEEIPMSDIQTYDISESMTIPLKTDEDGEPHFCMVSVTLSMNTKDKGFKTYGADLSGQESLIKSEIIDVFGQYTLSEARDQQDEIRQEILQRVQKMFDSEFIFNISFSNILFQ